jgi:ABC-type transport system involved in cytochrome c biogenesis permease component
MADRSLPQTLCIADNTGKAPIGSSASNSKMAPQFRNCGQVQPLLQRFRLRGQDLFKGDARAHLDMLLSEMLSILQRELQREARRPRALWRRVICTGIGFLACLILLLNSNSGGAHGRRVFEILTFIGFAFCLIEGVGTAAGTIADEKRDGTLPLLFLTALTPSGIVMGKFLAVAIPLIQPFFAFVPALAITVLVGGVTGGEVFRAVMVFGVALHFSIALGLAVSSFSRRNESAGRTTLALIFLAVGGPLLFGHGKLAALRFFSPWTAFGGIADTLYQVSPADFWMSVVALLSVAFELLLIAAFFLPKRWQPEVTRFKLPEIFVAKLTNQERLEVLDRNPGEWLALRRGINLVEQILFVGAIGALAVGAAILSTDKGILSLAFIAVAAAAVLFFVRLASLASYPLCNARRSGEFELLLCTPLDALSLITGQIAALRKQFTWPLIVVVAAVVVFAFRANESTFGGFLGAFLMILYLITIACSIAALGIFIGVVEKSPAAAFFQTIFLGLFVAGPLSLFSAPVPLIPLMLLGFAGNRLVSAELPKYLKRQPRATTPAHAYDAGRLLLIDSPSTLRRG